MAEDFKNEPLQDEIVDFGNRLNHFSSLIISDNLPLGELDVLANELKDINKKMDEYNKKKKGKKKKKIELDLETEKKIEEAIDRFREKEEGLIAQLSQLPSCENIVWLWEGIGKFREVLHELVKEEEAKA